MFMQAHRCKIKQVGLFKKSTALKEVHLEICICNVSLHYCLWWCRFIRFARIAHRYINQYERNKDYDCKSDHNMRIVKLLFKIDIGDLEWCKQQAGKRFAGDKA